jgi:type II secretory pathway pseudopilin PulG
MIQKRRKGSSLIEVLFASFLVALCASVLAASIPTATKSRLKATYSGLALSLAQKELEAIRTRGYANVSGSQLASLGLLDSATPVSSGTFSFTNVDHPLYDSPARVLPGGEGFVTIEQVDLDLRRVTVRVEWTEGGQRKALTLGTLIANL